MWHWGLSLGPCPRSMCSCWSFPAKILLGLLHLLVLVAWLCDSPARVFGGRVNLLVCWRPLWPLFEFGAIDADGSRINLQLFADGKTEPAAPRRWKKLGRRGRWPRARTQHCSAAFGHGTACGHQRGVVLSIGWLFLSAVGDGLGMQSSLC